MKIHQDDIRKMREGMKTNHENRKRDAVERSRAEIFNNSSAGGSNDTVLDLSTPGLMSESFNEKKTGMTGIGRKDKDRDEEKMMRSMKEEVMKSVRYEFCATLQHRLESMRKDHERLTREALESMRDPYEDKISDLMKGHGTEMINLREVMEEANSKWEKSKTEAEMTEMATDVNESRKGEDPLGPRGYDLKEEN